MQMAADHPRMDSRLASGICRRGLGMLERPLNSEPFEVHVFLGDLPLISADTITVALARVSCFKESCVAFT